MRANIFGKSTLQTAERFGFQVSGFRFINYVDDFLRACARNFAIEGARVPHRLCIKAVHPLRKGVTGATRVLRETHPYPPCLGREQVLLHQISYQFSIASIPSLCREGWGGSLNSLENFLQNIIENNAKYHRKQQIL